ncbi:MAG: diacylglycerol kinase [Gammaproteobacteria bacterium]|nr:diacylglycerol kinase [Gammaproteobacteria bacterium]
MGKPGNTGLMRIFRAAGYSWAGLRAAFRHEAAFRQELALCCLLIPLGLWLGQTGSERALLIGSLLLVLIVELINSAIEAVVDRFGGEQHELSGRAKDIGSAAVFIALLNVVIVWGLIVLTPSTAIGF